MQVQQVLHSIMQHYSIKKFRNKLKWKNFKSK
jgi:hypothetical protein